MADEKFTLFWGGPFSQWHPSTFVVYKDSPRPIKFNCAEQYMMACKASLFKDWDTYSAILRATAPRAQKEMGRSVKQFNVERWESQARLFVYDGNYLKFSQNPDLLKLLLATAGTTIVEASPHDCIWGIGLAEDNPKALVRSQWRGKNWLGEVLTKLREDFLLGHARLG